MGEDASNPIRPGATYEKFEVLEEVGRGSFASVYREFRDVNDFMQEIRETLLRGKKEGE